MLLFLTQVYAQTPAPKVWLGGGLVGVGGFEQGLGAGGGVEGRVGASLKNDPSHAFGLEARVREVYLDRWEVGSIGLVLRFPADTGPYVGLGFAHHHEAPLSLVLSAPGSVIAGINPDLTHRTGFEVLAGWDGQSPWDGVNFIERLAPFAELGLSVLPDSQDRPVYVFLDIGMRLGLGPR